MIFKEPINGASCNDIDLTSVCMGRIEKDLYRFIIEHYARLEMSIYAVYIPEKRKYDHYKWIDINIQEHEKSYSVIKEKTDGLFIPHIIPTEELEGEECGKIYCHALGLPDRDLYKDYPRLSYKEAKYQFQDDMWWLHIKIG